MTAAEILDALKQNGSDSYKRTMMTHGAREPYYGVKIEYMKTIQKKVKKNYELSLELYDSGISDAMYLAGLIADESKMTKKDLQTWLDEAYWYMLSEYTVPWIAAEGPYGMELAKEWIESPLEMTATAGWATLASVVSIKPDSTLDIPLISSLIKRVEKTIHTSQNRVRYAMNGFIIATGSYVAPLLGEAMLAAQKIGKVYVDMAGTACKVPLAEEYILKVEEKGKIGKKKKMARC